jgi:hypothetical protein
MPHKEDQFEMMHDPKKRKLMPPFSGSPFGDFPTEYTMPNKKFAELRAAEKQASSSGSASFEASSSPKQSFLRSHTGTGGVAVSTAKPKPQPQAASPVAGAFNKREIPPTEFRRFYERGDLIVTVQHRGNGRRLHWKVDAEKLDYHHYLPIFFDGLRELEEPYKFIAEQGCYDLLAKGGSKILPTIPQLIIPLKTALNTRHPDIVCTVLRVLQKLVVSGDLIGEALVPYYRQLLPVLNMFKVRNLNIGDGIEYSQRKQNNLGDLIHETLQLLEKHGGEDAFINIKYMVPTYESCVLN